MSTSTKPRFLPSDLRDIRVAWLSQLYVTDSSSRVKCSEVLEELAGKFTNVSSRECGFVIRKCFPNVKRIHSNHVYHYSGIRRILNTELLNPFGDKMVIQKEGSQDIPKCFFIKRDELLDVHSESPKYNFDNGIISSAQMRNFRGISATVRECETDITSEAKIILGLPSHPCLPILIGICCDYKPFLIVTKFYGYSEFGLMLSLAAVIKDKKTNWSTLHWMSIVQDITKGLLHMHANGFYHGDVQPCNIILHRKCQRENKFLQPVFLNLEQAGQIKSHGRLVDCNLSLFDNDVHMFACLVENIEQLHTTEGDILRTVSQMAKLVVYGENVKVLEAILVYLKNNNTGS